MVIDEAKIINGDPEKIAWSGLRRFQNIDFVEERIFSLHRIDRRYIADVRKQAQQIRYCLIQAKEYFDAAKSVSLATKPNLLYYSVMCMALAEILLKQNGESSLDRAREQHRHHGLELKYINTSSKENSLSALSGLLLAKPIHRDGVGIGTFDLWHISCREMPIAAMSRLEQATGTFSESLSVIFSASDERLPMLPKNGLSLLDCLQSIPSMAEYVISHSIIPNLVRAKVSSKVAGNYHEDTIIVHPSETDKLHKFSNSVIAHPSFVNFLTFKELNSGYVLNIRHRIGDLPLLTLPHATVISKEEVRFWTENRPLNEFGYFYLAMFICGNYTRYYPDKWLLDVEKNSSLALAIEELTFHFERRAPLLGLSEMSRQYHVMSS